MLSEKQISALRASFPAEALSADTSRGFELTSIKAAFIVERLNEVFGPCGAGWRYVHSPFEWADGEVITEVALQFQVAESGVNGVIWDGQSHGWAFVPGSAGWSWPILAPGGRRPGKGTAPLTDARKGAITDGLTKAASMIGVGHEVFKGLVRVAQPGRAQEGAQTPRQPQQPRTPAPAPQRPLSASQQPPGDPGTGFRGNGGSNGAGHPQVNPGTGFRNGNGSNGTASRQPSVGTGSRNGGGNGATTTVAKANATTYWQKANDHTGKLDRAQVSALARQVIDGKLSWLEAQSRLDDWIDAATLPSFGAGNGKAKAEKVSVAVSHQPMAERASDPLDELFE